MSTPYNPDPAAPQNNLHHTGTYRDNDEFLDELLGRGAGDPDHWGYPGEPTITHSYPPLSTVVDDSATIQWQLGEDWEAY